MTFKFDGVRSLEDLRRALIMVSQTVSLPWHLFPTVSGERESLGTSVVMEEDLFRYLEGDTRRGLVEVWRGSDAHELIYQILCAVCTLEAADWEAEANLEEASGYVAFIERQLDKLDAIDPKWRARRRDDYMLLWKRSPYGKAPFPL